MDFRSVQCSCERIGIPRAIDVRAKKPVNDIGKDTDIHLGDIEYKMGQTVIGFEVRLVIYF